MRVAFAVFLVGIILSTGCRPDPELIAVEVERQHRWERFERLSNRRAIRTGIYSDTLDRKLYLPGVNNLAVISYDSEGVVEEEEGLIDYVLTFYEPLVYGTPINRDLVVSTSSDQFFRVSKTTSPNYFENGLQFYGPNLDTAFIRYDFPYWHQSVNFGLTDDNYLLVSYLRKRHDQIGYDTEFTLIEIDQEDDTHLTSLEVTSMQKIDKPEDWGKANAIHVIDNTFFVATSGATYRIFTDGTWQLSYDSNLFDMFELNGHLFAITWNGLIVSNDMGASWQTIQQIGNELRLGRYRTIDRQIVGFFQDQLFRLEFLETGLTGITYLDNDGLEGEEITGIAVAGERVYISTLGGVFSRQRSEFFTPIEE